MSTLLTSSAQHPVAFFCAEFGIDTHLPIYAGGLGILAGDILKEAVDEKLHYIGVGLLYRGEGAIQEISADGQQIDKNNDFDPIAMGLEHVYMDDMPVFIKVHLTELDVWLRCWKKQLSETVTLYLLDPDTEQNLRQQRHIAYALYAGSREEMIKQQLLLGIGGVKLLHHLGIHPSLYHVNEGRPSFIHWQLVRDYMETNGLKYEEAVELARAKTVYTNHTLLEAGNEAYHTHLFRAYGEYYANKMQIPIDQLLAPGMDEANKLFSVTQYALNTSRKASSVSQIHFQFCQKQWPQNSWVNITNGIHMPTWQNPEMKIAATTKDPAQIWQAHLKNKQALLEYVKSRTGYGYDPNRLVIGWARRITGYKQLSSLFNDVQRLRNILAREDKPAQLLIAGKAHIYDTAAKQVIQQIIQYMQHELSGLALFIPNLDIELDSMLVRGTDLWLNTPEFGKEACGTSGMKAISNGVLQCTVADGWAHEVNWDGTGWVLDYQQLAPDLYQKLETEIAPLFYDRNSAGLPLKWIERIQRSIELSAQFSSRRMMHEYWQKLYVE